ncbi:hypothetical protein [Actinoalloteichus hymeniacidonis]|uniref:Uncharacterized protein n=1 Tax=Actinoalloteichus hymeniacidonis TaxID=340345 RepID=A0AAC9N0A9_9PSEU|nr:hypothetical protein [Actinoalloteichus hymeniacidonis]AOS65384.1 hypothetical protein TL08_23020 [Actinoalloteichus hymeniacidonis]MBB5906530.1 hypothetical protein [Actinoalloteichus hymeniacidonis]
MVSVTDIAEQLRRAHESARAARSAALRAEALIDAGTEIFDGATR